VLESPGIFCKQESGNPLEMNMFRVLRSFENLALPGSDKMDDICHVNARLGQLLSLVLKPTYFTWLAVAGGNDVILPVLTPPLPPIDNI